MQDLIEMGWLTPIKIMVEEIPKGLDDVGMTGGDYNQQELSDFMSDAGRISNVFDVWQKYAKNPETAYES